MNGKCIGIWLIFSFGLLNLNAQNENESLYDSIPNEFEYSGINGNKFRVKKYQKDSFLIFDSYLNSSDVIWHREVLDNESREQIIEKYYPESNVSISNCEFSLGKYYSKTDTIEIAVTSNLDQELRVNNIENESNIEVKIGFEKLLPFSEGKILFIRRPDRYNRVSIDEVRIDFNGIAHYFFISENAVDLDWQNINDQAELKITKKKTGTTNMYFGAFGTHNLYFLSTCPRDQTEGFGTTLSTELNDIGANGIMEISSLRPGRYCLSISGERGNYNAILIIEEENN